MKSNCRPSEPSLMMSACANSTLVKAELFRHALGIAANWRSAEIDGEDAGSYARLAGELNS